MVRTRKTGERVTIKAVAERAGVSVMTVSNVMNGLPVVKAATRERVLAVVRELGYVPSQAARRLIGAECSRIGLVYFDHKLVMMDTALAAISIAAAERGLQLIMRKLDLPDPTQFDPAALPELLFPLLRSGAEALLLVPPIAEILARSSAMTKLGVPVAAIETATALPGMASFRIDNRAAARAVTNLMIAQGRRRIGVITGPLALASSKERFDGHCDALRQHGIDFAEDLHAEGPFTFEAGHRSAEHLLRIDPALDAIVCGNDDIAAGAMIAAHRRGCHMPDDLALAGFDDSPLATRLWPSLTSVRQPLAEMVGLALDHLVGAMRGGPRACDVVMKYELMERGSTGNKRCRAQQAASKSS